MGTSSFSSSSRTLYNTLNFFRIIRHNFYSDNIWNKILQKTIWSFCIIFTQLPPNINSCPLLLTSYINHSTIMETRAFILIQYNEQILLNFINFPINILFLVQYSIPNPTNSYISLIFSNMEPLLNFSLLRFV